MGKEISEEEMCGMYLNYHPNEDLKKLEEFFWAIICFRF